MIAKITVCVLLIGMLCASAAAQSGCGYGVVYGVSGYAASPYDPEPTAATAFQPGLQLAEETYGPANCTFTLTYADWYGDCQIPGFGGNCLPAPPITAPQDTAPGPSSCPSCVGGKPINFTNGNVYIQQTDVKLPGLGRFYKKGGQEKALLPGHSKVRSFFLTSPFIEPKSSNPPQRLCHPRIVSNL